MMAVMKAEATSFAQLTDNIVIEGNRLVFREGTTFEQWRDAGSKLSTVARGLQLLIGDWAREGEKRGFYTSSKTYDEITEITGINRRTLQDYKTVADRVRDRHADLSFAHHREVATLSPDLQATFLERAAQEKLTIRQLRDEVRKTLPKREQQRLKTRDEVTRLLQLEDQADEEREDFEAKVTRIVDEINALPLIYRIKVNQRVSWKRLK